MGWAQVFLLAGGALYAAAVLWLLAGIRRKPQPANAECPSATIVVAARNEAAQIEACCRSLRAQDYRGPLEIVVVDDRSSDATAEVVSRQAAQDSRIRLLHAPATPRFRCPKKSALAWGIERSEGELILCTDADCRPPNSWVRSMVAHFAPAVGLVAGYARPTSGRRLHQHLLALDNLAVGALAAGSFGMGRPLSCTGRNLAYRRQLYKDIGGFSGIGELVGGDDVYFARLAARRTSWRLVFNARKASVVSCLAAPESWKDVLHQKLRHAGKAGHYSGGARILGIGLYLFHAALAASLVRLLQGQVDAAIAGTWTAKILLDLALTGSMATPDERRLLFLLPVLELVYVPYVLVFTIVGRLGWYRWRT